MEGPKSVELTRTQIVDTLNTVLMDSGNPRKFPPADRSAAKGLLAKIEALPEYDKKFNGFPRPEEQEKARKELLPLLQRREEEKDPEKLKAIEAELEPARQKFADMEKAYIEGVLFVPWDRKERAVAWKFYRAELLGACTMPREAFILGIAKALGKSGDAQDALNEAIEESEEKEPKEPEDVKPELVK